MTVIDFRHTAPTRAASSLWQAHGYLPVPICRHSPSQGQTGAVFPLSGLRPAGRAESGSGLPPGSPVIRRRRVRQSRTGALLAPSKGRGIHLSPYLSEHALLHHGLGHPLAPSKGRGIHLSPYLSEHALLHHGLGHPLEAGDVGAGHQVVPQAVFSCRLHAHLVDGVHDLV